jgi:hypothetical protein
MSASKNESESSQPAVMEVGLHPVQLQRVLVRELFIKAYRALPLDYVIPDEDVRMESGFNEYNSGDKVLNVHARVFIGEERDLTPGEEKALVAEKKLSLRMRVHLVGQYTVDEKRFPLDLLDEWSRKGGAMTLFPYAREHVYSLSARCGIRPIILPVMQLQTVKITPPKTEQTTVLADTPN